MTPLECKLRRRSFVRRRFIKNTLALRRLAGLFFWGDDGSFGAASGKYA